MNKKIFFTFLFLLSFLFLTNRYLSYQDGIQIMWATDTQSYRTIAEAAPHFPMRLGGYFHHDQRFLPSYLIGILSKLSYLDLHLIYFSLTCLTIFLILMNCGAVFKSLSLNSYQILFCFAVLIFNPYVFRYYLAVPTMINDLLFVLGLTMVLNGLFTQRVSLLWAGQLLSCFSRQTSLFLVPAVLIWIWMLWKGKGENKSLLSFSFFAVSLLIYLCTGWVATDFFKDQNHNTESILGLVQWLRFDFNFKMLAEFVVRALTPFLFVFSSLVIVLFKRRTQIEMEFKLLFLFLLLICVQPFLGGPAYTGQNIIRLNTLSIVPVVIMLAMLLRKSQLLKAPNINYWALLGILVLSSFHHMYSVIKGGPEFAGIFFAFYSTLMLFYSALFYTACRPSLELSDA